jgi:hypothetical protein
VPSIHATEANCRFRHLRYIFRISRHDFPPAHPGYVLPFLEARLVNLDMFRSRSHSFPEPWTITTTCLHLSGPIRSLGRIPIQLLAVEHVKGSFGHILSYRLDVALALRIRRGAEVPPLATAARAKS